MYIKSKYIRKLYQNIHYFLKNVEISVNIICNLFHILLVFNYLSF